MSTQKARIDYLDIAKAVAIFLVMMGHIADSSAMFFYRRVIYSFHMPLFLIISGIVTKHRAGGYSTDTWKSFIKKNAFALIIPYFFWGLLYCKFSYTSLLQIVYASWKTITDSGSVLALWYLVCLFLARIEMEAVLALSDKIKMNRHLFALIISPIPFAIGILLPKLEIGYPWEFNVSFVALGFLLLGYAAKNVLKKLTEKGILLHIVYAALSVALFAIGLIIHADELELILLLKVQLGNLFWFFYLSLTGSAAVLSLSMLAAKIFGNLKRHTVYDGVLWFGRNTLAVFVLHKPILPEVIVPFLINMGMNKESILTAIVGSIIVIPFAVIATLLIKRFCPVLLGLHKKKSASNA